MNKRVRTQSGTVLSGLLVPMLCVGMHTGRLCASICESRAPYDTQAGTYPTTEAEPLKTHSQAEPGNERFSILSRFCPWPNKQDLVNLVSEKTGISKKAAGKAQKAVYDYR